MKRFFFFLLVLSVIASSVLIVWSKGVDKRFDIARPEVLKNTKTYPIGYMMSENTIFNPLYPFFDEMDLFTMKDTVFALNEGDEITILLDQIPEGNLYYEIIEPQSKKLAGIGSISDEQKTVREDGVLISFKIDPLKSKELHVLKFILEEDDRTIYYYQSFYYHKNDMSNLLKSVSRLHNQLFSGDKHYKDYMVGKNEEGKGSFYTADQNSSSDILLWNNMRDFVKMNEPVPEVIEYDAESGNFEVRMNFTVGIRKDYAFEYWDFTEVFKGRIQGDAFEVSGFERKGHKKNEPYFDQEELQWVLDEGNFLDIEQILYSPKNGYAAFVYGDEVWQINLKYNTLTKVFGFDKLDSDYIMDESKLHNIYLLEADDKGLITYIVYGYMGAGAYAGYNGVLVNTFQEKDLKNETQIFVEMGMSYHQLKFYVENYSYYNGAEKQLHLGLRGELYTLDLAQKTVSKIMDRKDFFGYAGDGILYYEENNGKDNRGIKLIDLSGKDPSEFSFIYENKPIRIIDGVDGKVIIGNYSLEKTYESLNGEVFYPYEEILLISKNGQILEKWVPDEGQYFQDVRIDQEGKLLAASYGRKKTTGSSPAFTKVSYEKTGERLLKGFSNKEIENKVLFQEEVLNNRDVLLLGEKGVSLKEKIEVAAYKSLNKNNLISLDLNLEKEFYELYKGNKLIAAAVSMEGALKQSKEAKGTSLYQNIEEKRTIYVSSSQKGKKAFLEVPLFLQLPELARGCETTALSMLLSYHKGETIDKSILAGKLRKDDTKMETVDGMIYFGDMNKGFVGSIDNRRDPGLGVYIKPLKDLASQYFDNVHDITGAEFEHVMGFVEMGTPVLVISPVTYNSVSDRSVQVWKTDSGYMEVTFLEHSVVIVGFDSEYVYLNDPLQSRVIKKPIQSFQKGWESMGSRALIVR